MASYIFQPIVYPAGQIPYVPSIGVPATNVQDAIDILAAFKQDGDKGDIIISGSGTVWNIDTNVVTNSKLSQVPTYTIKGRITAGTGNLEDLTPIQVKTILNLTGNYENSGASLIAQAFSIQRANHSGTQLSSTISDFNSAARAQTEAELIAGSNITITPSGSGATRVLTISAAGGAGATNLTTTAAPTTVTINSDTGTDAIIIATDGVNAGLFLPAEKTKLSGVANNATANSSDAFLLSRINHTGTQSADTIIDGSTNKAFTSAEKTKLAAISGVNTGDQTITLTGNVTGSGTGSFAATIANDAVTNAKLSNMATQTFKGRTTAATGDPEDLTVAQAKVMLNLSGTNNGDQDLSGLLVKASNLSDLTNATTARTNLGLGTAATTNSTAYDPSGSSATAQAFAIQRVNHSGTQLASTISDFNNASRAQTEAELVAGANITITPSGSGASRILTISSSGGGGGGSTNLTTTAAPTTVTINSDTGTDAVILAADVTNAGLFLPAEKTKLSGVAVGATANSSDAFLLNRINHTGSQLSSTISDFNAAVRAQTELELIAGGGVTITPGGSGATRTLTFTAGSSSMTRQTFTSTAGQTVFTISGGYSGGNIDVYRNGVKLQPAVEVDITSGTVITLTTASSDNDIIQVVGLAATSSSNLSDGTKVDVTVSGGASTITINNNVVTNAKLAQVATGTIKGRATAGTGNLEDLTPLQARTVIDAASKVEPVLGGNPDSFPGLANTTVGLVGFTGDFDAGDRGQGFIQLGNESVMNALFATTLADTQSSLKLGTYTHTQGAPASTWTMNHNLGRYPSVSVVDSGGSLVFGEVKYNSINQAQVIFSAAFAGSAYLN